MKFKDSKFVKPKEGEHQPTRLIYLSGVGHGLNTDPIKLQSLLTSFGPLDRTEESSSIDEVLDGIYMPEGRKYVVIQFKDLECAISAYRYFQVTTAIPELNVSKLAVRYAALAHHQPPPEPECTSLTTDVVIPGLYLIENFLEAPEELNLLRQFDQPHLWRQTLNRRVQQYGFPFNYRTLMIDYAKPTPPLPLSALNMGNKIKDYDTNILGNAESGDSINQLTINEYISNQGIAAHIGKQGVLNRLLAFGDSGSGIVMNFSKRVSHGIEEERKKSTYLPPRSLLILSKSARYEWHHGISPRKFDKVDGVLIPRGRRISFTFRHVVKPTVVPSRFLLSGEIEEKHVVHVYDAIAVHWNHTRGKRKVHWQTVKSFIESLPPGSLLADIGSGDGKYFGINPGVVTIGCDRSLQLLTVSKDKSSGHETFCCDAVKLPLQSESFDAVICIAVLHHLATIERRFALISELLRICKLGGFIFIQAWALEQEASSKHFFASQDTMVPWKLNRRFVIEEKLHNEEKKREAIVRDDIVIYDRYCHVYKEGELEDLCSRVPNCRFVKSGYEKGNWYVKLQKICDERLINEVSMSEHPANLQERGSFSIPIVVTRLTKDDSKIP